jgi:hypothetical protein
MLDGEIFAIKTALAILKYRENQLINQPYNKIITFLRGGNSLKDSFSGLDMTFLDEEKLFKVIESIDIDNYEYYDDLKIQKWSYQKSKIFVGVFK